TSETGMTTTSSFISCARFRGLDCGGHGSLLCDEQCGKGDPLHLNRRVAYCYETHRHKRDEENVMKIMKDKTADQTLCPVARAESVVGDRWAVLILRELFMRMHRFEEIQAQTGATPQKIAARLKKLEA